ncbi:Uncharacterised protein [Salmonella enterica subsp. enterica serovar Typhi]|nr:Uncharacterised protein [Salmonella enterica subsp. enterica serovar Typhi]CHC28266.1 Uncharacterised protein [Salmonella enterica subsp. enterica serovar Typhi]CHK74614.1 Uncharacterised protein [Salmonella enterica subsp. enterica serovar Typhi]
MCPTAISMNAYVLRIHILPYVVELCSESVLTRHPDTGLARMSLRGLRVLEFFVTVEKNLNSSRKGICNVSPTTHKKKCLCRKPLINTTPLCLCINGGISRNSIVLGSFSDILWQRR